MAGFVPVQLTLATPANNALGVAAGVIVNATLTDGSVALNTNSVQVTFDGLAVVPTVQKSGATTTVSYDPPGLLAPLSAHTYSLAYNNNGGATPNVTNVYAFTVGPWVNLNLGSPIHLENFDAVAEGALPTGWSVTNLTDSHTPGNDLNDILSDSYLDWVVISRTRLIDNLIVSNSDFTFATNVRPNQVVNNSPVTSLITSNFIFAVSDRGVTEKQIQYLFTRDYNLSGQNNVYLSFHNIYIQNQDNIAAVEYSIDGGTTWLPGLYLMDGNDLRFNSTGSIDASNTLATTHGDVPDPVALTLSGGAYGQFIGVNSNQWAGLAPYLQTRFDDNTVDSMRVEAFRLPQADNQPAVRFRFVMMGTFGWYFGIDNFGLYSIPSPNGPLVGSPTPTNQTVAVGNAAQISVPAAVGIGPITYQWRRNGVNLARTNNNILSFPIVLPGDGGTYDVVVSNPGGSVTSPPPASVLNVFNPTVLVTGQWDFNNSNLVATCGADLQYFDSTVSNDTSFATTTAFGLPDINGQPTTVLRYVPSTSAWGGYRMFHGAAPNGGGAYVNQYTLVIDYYIPSSTFGIWHSLLQTGTGNTSDGDLFVNPTGGGIGISSIYNGNVTFDTWHRVAVAFDLSGPGEAPVLTKFINGVKVGNQTTGLSDPDGRFALDPFALLFADQDGDTAEAYVSSVQFSNGRRPDAFLAALGGPTASKIPGCITANVEGGNVVVRWTGGVPLEGSDEITGPWTTVPAATSPYTVPQLAAKKFYRPKIP